MLIPIRKLLAAGGTQPCRIISFDVVDDYIDEMQAEATLRSVVTFYESTDYRLADGFHRVKAPWQAVRTEIQYDVHQVTLQHTQWDSFGMNKSHGLRSTNKDEPRVVKAALTHPTGAGKSNSAIAKHVGVIRGRVRHWPMRLTKEIPNSDRRTGQDRRTINTEKIGKHKARRYADCLIRVIACFPSETIAPVRGRDSSVFEFYDATLASWRYLSYHCINRLVVRIQTALC
jgi:hypothetical protein